MDYHIVHSMANDLNAWNGARKIVGLIDIITVFKIFLDTLADVYYFL